MDKAIVEKAEIEFFGIPSGKLRRYFSFKNVSDVFRIGAGFLTARKILKKQKPLLLFSKGGFVSVPPCAAAKGLGIPVFTHESDFSPGLATRINTRFAEKIFIAYGESMKFFTGPAEGKLSVSGNPIRSEFAEADAGKGRAFLNLENDERVLLVLGGSQGSREINSLIRECLPELIKYYTVVHQTGGSDAGTQASADNKHYKPYEYFREEIPDIIAAAELVICRSGANTIWECKSLGKPMVLIPLSGSATRGDQVENARLFEKAGAAVCFMPPPDGADHGNAVKKLREIIASLAEDEEKRRMMGEAKISRDVSNNAPDAAVFIAEEIVKRIRGREHEQHTGN
jgi:UDP-N-acetylglucosamine--N-acetylmuramyl-(pentapeptide) pyrophosphoryl-undecaprenol N-acetylglucosamine transferase